MTVERVETVVIGGGQAGLAVGYHLAQGGLPFVILDAHERIGDAWRKRWDSLRLFTPAAYDGLPGMPFPAPAGAFPTKDEMAAYLEAYAAHFQLPVRTGTRVDRLSKHQGLFLVAAGEQRFAADNVVVAMSTWQQPRVPAFARELDARVTQLHSIEYRRPSQLQSGGVLVVGAGNSGAEIALDAAHSHPTWLSGPDTGHLLFDLDGVAARLLVRRLVLRGLFHHVLTLHTPFGRIARRQFGNHGMPLIRLKPRDLVRAGITRVPRVVGVRDGQPVLEDGRVLDVTNVVWCTGFHAGLSWIELPIVDHGTPRHERGVAAEPGLYFVGLGFIYAASSTMVHGVGRDAEYVVGHIARHRSSSARRAVNRPALRPPRPRPSFSGIERTLLLGLGLLRCLQRVFAPFVELTLQAQALRVRLDGADCRHDAVDPRLGLEVAQLT